MSKRQAWWPRPQARQLFPDPVAPVTSTVWPFPILCGHLARIGRVSTLPATANVGRHTPVLVKDLDRGRSEPDLVAPAGKRVGGLISGVRSARAYLGSSRERNRSANVAAVRAPKA